MTTCRFLHLRLALVSGARRGRLQFWRGPSLAESKGSHWYEGSPQPGGLGRMRDRPEQQIAADAEAAQGWWRGKPDPFPGF